MDEKNRVKTATTSHARLLLSIPLIVSLLSLSGMIAGDVPMAHAEFIKCPQDADWNKYPICEYEEEWNESERFNSLVVQELGRVSEQINAMASNNNTSDTRNSEDAQQKNANYFAKMVSDIRQQIKDDNPGLWEESQRIKDWIYSRLAQKEKQ